MRRYLIIGTGPAGVSAAQAIRSQDASAEIILIGDEPQGYYSRPGLAYYLTGELPENGLFPFDPAEFQRLELKILHGLATQIDPQAHRVSFSNGQQLSYDRLLIATGAEANRVDLPGRELQGVVKLDTLADARQILKYARKARAAVVVGGGITALELVEGLRARKVKTNYFLRGDRYWSNVLEERESRIVEQRLQDEGVRIHYHTELAEILGKRGRVTAVRTRSGLEVKCQLVAIAIGIRPRMQLAQAAGLRVERGVLVNEHLQTGDADIYAAGDVAQVYDPASGKYIVDSLWGPAKEQGYAAGLNMAGVETVYCKAVPFNVTRLAGLTTTIIGTVGRGVDPDLVGIARGDSETWRQLPDAIAAQTGFAVNRLRVIVGEQHLLGAIVIGDQSLSQPLHHLVRDHADIRPIRAQLLHPEADLAEILVKFWTAWRKEYVTQ